MPLILSIALLAILALLWALLDVERVPTGEAGIAVHDATGPPLPLFCVRAQAQGAPDCGSGACAIQ
jgi:hypothetical protein